GGGGGGGSSGNLKKAQSANSETGASSAGSGARLGGPQSPLGEGGLPGVETELYQIGLDATWEIDIFGGTRRAVEAAADDLAAAVEDRRDVLTTLVAEIARDYLQLRGLQQRLSIARENLATQLDTLGLTQSRFKAGFVTELDVARAKTQVAETTAILPPLEAQIRQTIHALSVLVAQEPDALTSELTTTLTIPTPPPSVPVGLPSDLLQRRPDIRRAERQIAAANARVGVATADLFPKFSITGSLGLDSSHARNLFAWDSRYFLFSPGVSWNIFDAGRTQANIAAQTEQRQQLMLAYQNAVLQALKETEDALVNYATEQTRHAALSEAVQSARTSVNIARQQYEQGVIDFLVVLDTQRDLLSAEDALVQSDETIATNLVALYTALGGGWEVDAARQMN
ncbi:MAG: TolC family protein, partial [Tepidisphaeraceae bacterium]